MSILAVVCFLAAVFAAVFMLMLGLSSPASGSARMRRTLLRRLERIGADAQQDIASILREKYLTSLSPFERQLEELPLMEKLAQMREQAGRPGPAYQLVMNSLLLATVGGVIAGMLLHSGIAGLGVAAMCLAVPYLRVSIQCRRRMEKIEEQKEEKQ